MNALEVIVHKNGAIKIILLLLLSLLIGVKFQFILKFQWIKYLALVSDLKINAFLLIYNFQEKPVLSDGLLVDYYEYGLWIELFTP